MNDIERRQIVQEARWSAVTICATLAVLVGAVVWRADTAVMSQIALAVGIKVDLAACAPWFSKTVLGLTLYAAAGLPLALLTNLRGLALAYDQHCVREYLSVSLRALVILAVPIYHSIAGIDGAWMSGEKGYATFETACLSSHARFQFPLVFSTFFAVLPTLALMILALPSIALMRRGEPLTLNLNQEAVVRLKEVQAKSLKSLKRIGKWTLSAIILLVMVLVSRGVFLFVFAQATWRPAQAEIIQLTDVCIVEYKVPRSEKRVIWRVEAAEPCESPNKAPLASRFDFSGQDVRLRVEPMYQLLIDHLDGTHRKRWVPDEFIPVQAAPGDTITVLRSHEEIGFTRIATPGDWKRVAAYGALISVGLLMLWLLHRTRPGGPPRRHFGRA